MSDLFSQPTAKSEDPGIRPYGYPKTDGYPSKCPRPLWDRRQYVLEVLQKYPLGKEVKVETLAAWIRGNWKIKCNGAGLRKFLKTMLDLGYPVGANERGYYWAFYRGELTPTIEQLVARRTKIDERIMVAGQINRSLPERK